MGKNGRQKCVNKWKFSKWLCNPVEGVTAWLTGDTGNRCVIT